MIGTDKAYRKWKKSSTSPNGATGAFYAGYESGYEAGVKAAAEVAEVSSLLYGRPINEAILALLEKDK